MDETQEKFGESIGNFLGEDRAKHGDQSITNGVGMTAQLMQGLSRNPQLYTLQKTAGKRRQHVIRQSEAFQLAQFRDFRFQAVERPTTRIRFECRQGERVRCVGQHGVDQVSGLMC